MRKKNEIAASIFTGAAAMVAFMFYGTAALADFRMIYTPDIVLESPEEIDLQLVFTRPVSNGDTMDTGWPEQFFVVQEKKQIDLEDTLKSMQRAGEESQGQVKEANYSIERNGDYIFVMQAAPYYGESGDIYIQQMTNSFLSNWDIPSGWNELAGPSTEIVPLNTLYNVFAGSAFSSVLLSVGKPVPGAELEIESVAAPSEVTCGR